MTPYLRFEDINGTFLFEVKTNLINPTDDSFTIVEVSGVSNLETSLGINLKQLPSTIVAMKALANSKGLKLTRYLSDGSSSIISALNANIIYYSNNGLGIDNL